MSDPNKNKSKNGILRRFKRNGEGIAAVEFALIVPLLLAMYLGTIEVSNGITVNKRTARVASTVADLVTQQPSVSKASLEDILEIGAAIMFPYNTTLPVITVTGIDVDDDYPDGGKIIWSRRYNKGTFNGGLGSGLNTDIEVPTRLRIDDTFLVKVTAEIEYRPIVTWIIGEKTDGSGNSYTALDMSEEYYLRPRLSDEVLCTDC
ncbi:MAG: TadE/TadG family type IV pilus assembly protein [Pseudomonadota bacterium]